MHIHLIVCLVFVLGGIPSPLRSAEQPTPWVIEPSLKCDAFCFLDAISKVEFYNRMYVRDYTLWRERLGTAAMDSIAAIQDSISSIGFKASYLFAYLQVNSTDDIVRTLRDSAALRSSVTETLRQNSDFRIEASIKDLDRILSCRSKLIFLFGRMKDAGWEEDWRAISERLSNDIRRQTAVFTRYSPAMLRSEVTTFLGQETKPIDSDATVYYLYYAFPNAFKLPYGMMGTWNIENPYTFFNIFLHEMLHQYSIQLPGSIERHRNLMGHSAELAKNRDILVNQLYESDDEFYVLAAEAFLSVKLGLRTDPEAREYLKSCDGGTARYSLVIYDHVKKSFRQGRQSYADFINKDFFKTIRFQEVDSVYQPSN